MGSERDRESKAGNASFIDLIKFRGKQASELFLAGGDKE